ncbi:probable protein S-acyltransferase 16 isoform X3 [Phalaenopsis equestris]|uniref:probable protein S-acyltransferase 16 isoform X3 n=1 Tax=Phalaenopsis equestris TaxID=78828 RepID=UPI0009E3B835|nr:probable protein S-acyltransferase 16 isoform X3 [Phalaenopsis equestris]
MGRDREHAATAEAGGRGGRLELNRPRYVTLPIILVLALIGYVYYMTIFGVIEDWLGLRTALGLGNAAIFTALAIMCLTTYAIAVIRDAGHVPSSFMPDIEDPQVVVHEIKRKIGIRASGTADSGNNSARDGDRSWELLGESQGGDLRYCQKCSHYKPPRAHHCRVCKTCVLRMDHHCVWINNCVGHANYKVFFVFMLYAVTACIHSLALFLWFVYDVLKGQIHSGGSLKTSHIIYGVLLFPLTLAVSILLGWHIYLVAHNKTTIEHYEGVRAMWLAKKSGNVYAHPYDLGIYENFIMVLGSNILCWICPTSSRSGSGLQFPSSYHSRLDTMPR